MTVPTYNTTIYVGLKETRTGTVMPFEEVEDFIQKWVDGLGQCVTVTRTNYIYTDGREPGVIVGFINYPRFAADEHTIRKNTLDLASELLIFCKQMRISVVLPDKTMMFSNTEELDANRL